MKWPASTVRWSRSAGRAALAVGDLDLARRATDALRPAAGELAGGGSGLLTTGPVDETLAALGG